MSTHPVTLFTGQWADLPFEEVARLLADPRFGPLIEDWRRHRSVPRRAKWVASGSMLASAVVMLAVMLATGSHRVWMLVLPIGCMAMVCVWLWLRPEPAPDR